MPRLGAAIRKRRKTLGRTLQQLANDADCSKAYLSAIENHRLPNPPRKQLLKQLEIALELPAGQLTRLADWQRTPPDVKVQFHQLNTERKIVTKLLQQTIDSTSSLSRSRDSNIKNLTTPVTPIPLINNVTAGNPADFTDLDYPVGIADEYISCPYFDDPDTFAARVLGDSMLPEYHPSDIIIFSPRQTPTTGSDCFIRLLPDHQTTFKRVFFENDTHVRLQPLNPAFKSQTIPLDLVSGLYPAIFRIQPISSSLPPASPSCAQ